MENLKAERKIFFIAVNTGYTENGQPDSRFIDFYKERSGKGLHCAIVGNVAIPNGHGTNSSTPKLENTQPWRSVAESIRSEGSLAGIQLSTTWEGYKGNKKFITSSPEQEIINYKKIASSFDAPYIKAQFNSLKEATKISVDCGFNHIQLHAAHGYFFNLVLDRRLSRHHELAEDSVHHWLTEIIPRDIETSIRISSITGAKQFDTPENPALEHLINLPFDYHDISEGFYNIDKKLIYPSLDRLLSARLDRTKNLALKFQNRKIIASGKSLAFRKDDLPQNIHIGICRDLIANPNFLLDLSNGCKNKMKCHYYSREKTALICGLWSQSSSE